ncbi:MAG: DUF411 domain-containing protein [Alphaproteobacteria bacterium]|nr:DUF411 domain-containing protein [Alphaproteobacteria bacterium]
MPLRRVIIAIVVGLLIWRPSALWADEATREATVYADPGCPCGPEYGRYLEANGFKVTMVVSTPELDAIKARYKIPRSMQSNQSTMIEGYVIEGNVPLPAILRLLEEKPPIPGIALPGTPSGSPGFGGQKVSAFPIFVITDDPRPPLFAIE